MARYVINEALVVLGVIIALIVFLCSVASSQETVEGPIIDRLIEIRREVAEFSSRIDKSEQVVGGLRDRIADNKRKAEEARAAAERAKTEAEKAKLEAEKLAEERSRIEIDRQKNQKEIDDLKDEQGKLRRLIERGQLALWELGKLALIAAMIVIVLLGIAYGIWNLVKYLFGAVIVGFFKR